ncbi:hypothetical protein NQ318_012426 [Aromia moschata]|uniref:HTH CENPB-type domain-containing protein n=1 Tax=Aromia moschata TaxID=1265417 RepID=A0AAV8Y483_9CUCU|nr:hypothetical protein NQ318_012426 [Aromia moschata]
MTTRKAFTIAKAAIVWRLEAGESNISIAKETDMPHSTISTICKHRDKIQSVFENSSTSVKKIRSCNQYRSSYTKSQCGNADDFVRQLKLQDFKCSVGWIKRFRKRHNIVFGKISGEAADVPEGVMIG